MCMCYGTATFVTRFYGSYIVVGWLVLASQPIYFIVTEARINDYIFIFTNPQL